MENLKVFACSDSAEKFTEEICKYLNIEKGIKRTIFHDWQKLYKI